MTVLTIRNIEDNLMTLLQQRARQHGRSVEEEALCILREALKSRNDDCSGAALYAAIWKRVEPFGGVALTAFPRETLREPQYPDDEEAAE